MHQVYMELALQEAREAFLKGEVPVGAVVVQDGQVIAKAHNLKEYLQDPTAHAEILALQEASDKVSSWNLTNATLYVTLEPCAMCAGAMIQARIKRLVYGAMDAKAGAAGSVLNIVEDKRLNHRIEVVAGIMEEQCKEILQRFFAERR